MFRFITLLSILSLGISQIVLNGQQNQELVNQKISKTYYIKNIKKIKKIKNVLKFEF